MTKNESVIRSLAQKLLTEHFTDQPSAEQTLLKTDQNTALFKTGLYEIKSCFIWFLYSKYKVSNHYLAKVQLDLHLGLINLARPGQSL